MKGTVIVTGGNGFIGSHVIEQLVSMEYKVISIDPREEGNLFVDSGLVEYMNGIIQNEGLIRMLRHRPIEHIIHLGAWSNVRESMTNPVKLYYHNTMSTAHIIGSIFEAFRRLPEKQKVRVKSLVFASSSAVESPESHYGVSKLASELMLNVFREQMVDKMSISNLRFGNVYGPRQNPANGTVIAKFVDCISTGDNPQIYGDGKQTRDYVYVKEVADAIITCMRADDSSESFYGVGLNDTLTVCSGVSWSVNEVYDAVKSAADSLGFDLPDPVYMDAMQGDKERVEMVQSHVLLEAGWRSEMPLRDGIIEQIKWADDMTGSWDDSHLLDWNNKDRWLKDIGGLVS